MKSGPWLNQLRSQITHKFVFQIAISICCLSMYMFISHCLVLFDDFHWMLLQALHDSLVSKHWQGSHSIFFPTLISLIFLSFSLLFVFLYNFISTAQFLKTRVKEQELYKFKKFR